MYIAVGSADALHSGIWKFWVQGDEFYAAETYGHTAIKISVHKSGVCRMASVQGGGLDDHEWDQDRDPRVIKRWQIAEVGAEDYTQCFSLLVPTVFIPDRLGVPGTVPAGRVGRVIWIRPAPLMYSMRLEFMRTRDDSPPVVPPYASASELVGTLDLRSGSRLWCYRYDAAMSLKDLSAWQNQLASATLTMTGKRPVNGELLATMTSPADHPFPVVRTLALGLSNMKFDDQ